MFAEDIFEVNLEVYQSLLEKYFLNFLFNGVKNEGFLDRVLKQASIKPYVFINFSEMNIPIYVRNNKKLYTIPVFRCMSSRDFAISKQIHFRRNLNHFVIYKS